MLEKRHDHDAFLNQEEYGAEKYEKICINNRG